MNIKRLLSFSPISIIDGLTAVLVVLIAGAALGISFGNLFTLANTNGFGGLEANLWAFQVDGFILVATLAVLRASLLGGRGRYPWGLVYTATAVSVLFNLFHQAQFPWLAAAMRGLPPVTLFLAFHLLMGFVGEWVRRRVAVKSLEQLEQARDKAENELEDFRQMTEREAEKWESRRERWEQERKEILKDLQGLRKEVKGLENMPESSERSGNGFGTLEDVPGFIRKVSSKRELLPEDWGFIAERSDREIALAFDVTERCARNWMNDPLAVSLNGKVKA